MAGKKILTLALLNELFDLEDDEIISLDRNLFIYKAYEDLLSELKPYLETIDSKLWYNYFENEIVGNKMTMSPSLTRLPEDKWRYCILQSNHDLLSIEQLVALRLSDLRMNVLVQRGFDVNSKGEYLDTDDSRSYVSKNTFETFNILTQTSNYYSRNGTASYVREPPDSRQIKNYQLFLRKIKVVYSDDNLNLIKKGLDDFLDLEVIPTESPFKIVSVFSIIELLLTTNPKNSGDPSIGKQLSNKIGLLYNNYFTDFKLEDYFKGSDTNTINTIIDKLYSYRSDIAHGNIPKFEKDLKILQDNFENILPFLNELLINILRFGIINPSIVIDLKKC